MLFSGEDTDNTHSDDITTGSNKPTETFKDKDDTETTVSAQMLLEMALSKGYTEAQICKKYKVSELKFIKKDIKKVAYEAFSKLANK